MAERGSKPKRGVVEAAARWSGLLGVVAAAAALVLVPVSVDLDAVLSNPSVAYYRAELATLLAVSAVLLVAVAGMLVFDRRPLRFPVLIPVLALLVVSALSTLFSEDPVRSFYGDRGEGLLSVAACVLLFYALAQGLTSRARLRFFLAAATTAAALVSVYGIAENYGFELISGWGNAPFTDLGRSSATIGNPLTLSAYLTLMMGSATALWMGASSRFGRLAWIIALALIGACWVYAETRGALLGVGIALPLLLLAARRRMGTLRPFAVPVAVLVAAMAVAVAVSGVLGFSTLSARVSVVLLGYLALVALFGWLLERGRIRLALFLMLAALICAVTALVVFLPGNRTFSNLGVTRAKPSVEQYEDLSLQTRLYIWRDTVPMVLDRPLLGHGPDNFSGPVKAYVSDDLKDLVSNGEGRVPSLDRAHNHTLQLAATIGLLGLAAYLWVLVSFFRNAYRSGEWAVLALAGAVLAYVLQLQTAFPSVATDVALWGTFGVSAALMRERRTSPAPPEHPAEGSEDTTVVADAGSRRARRRGRGSGRGELLVAAAVAILLAAIAVPAFAGQREKLAELEKTKLNVQIRLTVQRYERFLRNSNTDPKAGSYTANNPITNTNGRPIIKPAPGLTIRTEPEPGGDFTMEVKKRSLAGTFTSSYNSATGSYTAPR